MKRIISLFIFSVLLAHLCFGTDDKYTVDMYGCTSNNAGVLIGNISDDFFFDLVTESSVNYELVLQVRANALQETIVDSILWGVQLFTDIYYVNVPVIESADMTFSGYVIPFATSESIDSICFDVEVGIANYAFSYEIRESSSLNVLRPIETFQVYPNPATRIINISIDNCDKLEMFDVSGRKVIMLSEAFDSPINVSGLESGVYVVAVRDNDGKEFLSRFVKNN